jgi:hypothetical protein
VGSEGERVEEEQAADYVTRTQSVKGVLPGSRSVSYYVVHICRCQSMVDRQRILLLSSSPPLAA